MDLVTTGESQARLMVVLRVSLIRPVPETAHPGGGGTDVNSVWSSSPEMRRRELVPRCRETPGRQRAHDPTGSGAGSVAAIERRPEQTSCKDVSKTFQPVEDGFGSQIVLFCHQPPAFTFSLNVSPRATSE